MSEKLREKRNRAVPKKVLNELLQDDLSDADAEKVIRIMAREFNREDESPPIIQEKTIFYSGDTLQLGVYFCLVLIIMIAVFGGIKLYQLQSRIERNEDHVIAEEEARENVYQKAIGGK